MANLFKEYPPGMVLIIVLLLIDGIANLCNSVRSIVAAMKDIDKPMNDVRDILKDHGGRLETLERRIDGIDDDLKEIHAKDSKRERDERAEQRAILALLNHALTGNNEEEMKSAKTDLNSVVWGENEND